ncbi:MAG: LuxR family two component transcriptional regulator [Ramlibacter sp.]|jgi:two-component system nitrate/nitrite response regulator NarL|nr:LuxR family two component transcriptional regulator [Ramlibacter sp.]
MQYVGIRAVRVYLVAPPMDSWGLERLVQTAHPRLELSGTASCVADAVHAIEKNPADVIVLDLESDLESIAALKSTGVNILVLSGGSDVSFLDKAVLAGVRGIVKKSDPPAILLKAIEKVHEGELWIDRSATSRIFMEMARHKAAHGNDPEKTKMLSLTSRERQTIVAVAGDAAAPAKVIASRLCISEHTLRNHLTSIYSKLHLTSRLDLYAYATRHSLNKPF